MNDYTGRLLHDAHYEDLLKEARGGWQLKAARQPGESRQSRSPKRRLATRFAWALMAALLAALVITANFEPSSASSTTIASPQAVSQGQGVAP
jgi:ferric-dicitrate binding protein FerR (iron transport regulator)